MKIAVARTKTSCRWRTQEITWDELVARLRSPLRTSETVSQYQAMSKDDRDKAKEAAGGFVGGALSSGQRRTENVTERWLLTLDADSASPGAWDAVSTLFEFRMACYSTHSHTPEAPRLRWIIPTDRAMTPDEYPAVARRVAQWIGIDAMDPSTYEVARLMYWPTCSQDGAYEFHVQEGPVLCVTDVLGTYRNWRDVSEWPTAQAEQEVRARRALRAGDPLEKPGVVGLFCRVYDVPTAIAEFLPDVYTETSVPGRYTYVGGTTTGGAVVYNDGRFLYSNHASDPCSGQSVNAFDLVRIHKFRELDNGRSADAVVTSLPSFQAMSAFAFQQPDVARAQFEERSQSVGQDFSDMGEKEQEKEKGEKGENGENGDGPDWMTKLIRDPKTGKVKETLGNAILLVRNLPDLKGKLGYNPMSDSITVKGDLPWRVQRRARNRQAQAAGDLDHVFGDTTPGVQSEFPDWQENDWADFYAYMERWGFMTGRGKINGMLENAVKSVALEQTYHPIKSYLSSLEWDGVERVDTMLVRWLGAEDCKLNREVTRLWMIAAVDRVIRPGCQFDQILITCGPQGIGKTRLLRMLAKGFFTNSISALTMDKATAEKLRGMWIVELGELDGMRRGEQTAIKNFISATTDQYRGAYARKAEVFPRQCVLAGTSNEVSFLRDNTGERRYWIVPVEGKNRGELRGFEREVDQLWAEAVVRWKERLLACREPWQKKQSQVNLYLYLRDDDMEAEMEKRRQGYKLPEEDQAAVVAYLDTLRPANWYELKPYERRNFAHGDWLGDGHDFTLRVNRVCVKEIKYELFDGENNTTSLRIANILSSLPGWRKGKQRRNKVYAPYPMPSWVRIGSEEDKEEEARNDADV